jgi:hypothetical protein
MAMVNVLVTIDNEMSRNGDLAFLPIGLPARLFPSPFLWLPRPSFLLAAGSLSLSLPLSLSEYIAPACARAHKRHPFYCDK